MFLIAAVILFIAAEFLIGWWALPVVGLVLGLVGARRRGVALAVAGAATVAWLALFAWTMTYGNLGSFMHSLALSMKLPTAALVSLVALLPIMLAGTAARLGAGMRPETTANPVLQGH